MASLFNVLLTVGLVFLCFFLILIILMQRSSGMGGASFGSGAAESAFGGQANQVLVKATAYAIIAFFILSFVAYWLQLKQGCTYADRQVLPRIQHQAPATPEAGSLTQIN
jgi:protein translocase SecG subunit